LQSQRYVNKPFFSYFFYRCYKVSKKWCSEKIEVVDKKIGEIKEKPVYVLKAEHLGANMSIDDKCFDHKDFTILSNNDTGKIAMLIESTTANKLEASMGKFSRQDLQ
jgi:hypothetical protein